MTVFRRLRHILWRTALGMIALLIVLGIFSRIERTHLPNGLQLGRQYVWDGADDIYLWTKDGDLVAPFPVDLLCFNDRYIRASGYDGVSLLCDIENDVLTLSNEDANFPRWRASGLSRRKVSCHGYTNYLVGAGLIVQQPWRFRECTLSDPCLFNRR